MKEIMNIQQLKSEGSGKGNFSPDILEWISSQNLWNLWIPRPFGGLGLSLLQGLSKLQTLARTDGSLGWTVTLCSGANYFIGNLNPEVAEEIFLHSSTPVIFGGSGGVSGTAEKTDEGFVLRGKWKYATGAPYLTHFTLNARVTQDGIPVKDEKGKERILSFVISKDQVSIIEDWDTMGLEASATHSFEVRDIHVHEKYSFKYNDHHLPHSIFKIDFSVFADLTLWVNYLGMAEHFLEESKSECTAKKCQGLQSVLLISNEKVNSFAADVESEIMADGVLSRELVKEVHREAASSIRNISLAITELYPFLGIRACWKSSLLNKIFRDYFTATQHHIFTRDLKD